MARQMKNVAYIEQQRRRLYEAHIAPINRLVDELRQDSDRGWAPYVAPIYGGTDARLLYLLRDPGPKTRDMTGGSGFLSMENDDPTAERICTLFSAAGIEAPDIVPWNAYPWYINRAPKAAELNYGVVPLKCLLDMLPRLQVVMFLGGSAQNSWKRIMRAYPGLVADRNLEVISTYHTSLQAFWHANPTIRDFRKNHLRNSFAYAAHCLQSNLGSAPVP